MKERFIKIFTILLLLSFVASPAVAAPPNGYLRVVHLAPFAEDASVTVSVDGEDVLTEFGYGDSTDYIPLRVGDHDIAVTPTGATEPVLEVTVNLGANSYYTAIAVGDIVNQPLALLQLEDDNSAPEAGNFKLRLGHLAPFAPDPDTTADVRLDDGTLLLDDVQFGTVAPYVELPAGEYDLKITTPDGETTLINLAPVTLMEGQILSAFAVGNGTFKRLEGYALPYDAPGFFLPLEARLQVAHLAPFADPGTVDIELNGVPALQDVDYGDSTGYIELVEGTYDVEIFPEGSDTAAISALGVELTGMVDYTAIAIGDGVNQDLSLKLLIDDNSAPEAGNFKLRLGHLAPFAADPDTTADVRLDDGTVILDDVDFGDVDAYAELPAGEYDLKVTTPDGALTLIDLAPVTFTEGQILSAFAVGNGTIQPLGGFALPAGEPGFFLPLEEIETARLQIAHLAPFADPATVDISLNGTPVPALQDFDYGDSTAYLELPEGTYDIDIFPDGSGTAAISVEDVPLVGGMDYTAIAIGDGTNQDLSLTILEDDNTAPAAGNFKLRLGHLAPFADTLAGTLADIRQDDGTPVLENVDFGDVVPYMELPAGEYDLKVTTPGGGTTLINLAPITFTEGQILSAFAVGDGTNQDLGGFALPADAEGFFLPLDMARLQVAHLAPFADPGTVDIELNGELALENVDYGDSTGYLDLMEGSYLVEIIPDGATDPAISETVDLVGGNDYTAIAVGDITNQSLDLLALMDDNTAPAAGNFKLRLGHLAPFADTLAGTLADIRQDDGTPVLENVDFGDVAPYMELPAGEYDLKVTTPGGGTTLINLAPITFTEGQILSAFAVGDGTNQDLGGFALPADAEGFFLPLDMARLQVAHLAPFADPGTVDIELNGELTLENVEYGDSTGYLDLMEGSYLVEITPDGAMAPAISEIVDLVGDNDYTAIAVGDGVNQPLDLLALMDDNTAPAAGTFKLRLGHLAPFADTLPGTLADVRLDDGTVILDDVEFGDVDAYAELPAGVYDLKVTTPDGATTLIDLAPVSFMEGQILSAFAVGNGSVQPLGGFALPAGEPGFFLPLEGYILYLPMIFNGFTP